MSRKIDTLIAEHIFGLEIDLDGNVDWSEELNSKGCKRPPKEYSTDIAAAWEVMETLHDLYEDPLVVGRNPYVDREEFCVMYMNYDCLEIFAAADTPSLAICLAALRAKGVKHD